eukprot:CAMPEP_0176463852 /NCGR_PEP_ID=MMETSP0127-20121128/36148_1 /TAXON_ID=938130 /ORGANISM="Platyophrya macrostoma, Strain WH" /LENGTH=1442 /DNA_ID=CAMNT_0017856117 /DNA_START=247 /DNA_END=4575 /DNA_ORIENTATION=+
MACFLMIYVLLLLNEVVLIVSCIKGHYIGAAMRKVDAVVFLAQKSVIMIPALLLAAKECLESHALLSQMLGGLVIGFVSAYNLLRVQFKITIPYNSGFQANAGSMEGGLRIVLTTVGVFLMRVLVQDSFQGNAVLAFSIVYLIINFYKIINATIFPYQINEKLQLLYLIAQFSSVYSLLCLILSQWGTLNFPLLLLMPFAVKLLINSKVVMLNLLYRTLRPRRKGHWPVRIRNLAIRSLVANYCSLEKPNYQLFDVLKPVLDRTNHVIERNRYDSFEYPLITSIKPAVLKYIEDQYLILLGATTIEDSYYIRLCQIQFYATICHNPLKATLFICETMTALKGIISVKQQTILDFLQEFYSEEFKSELSLKEIMEVQDLYEKLMVRTQNLVKIRAQILCKLTDPACDLFALKTLGVNFSNEANDIIANIKNQIKNDCMYMGTLNLYEYIQTCLFEMPVAFETSMFQDALEKAKNLLESDFDLPPDKKIFANITNDSTLFYVAFSLDRRRFGQIITCSKSCRKVLGIPETVEISAMTMENIFPTAFSKNIRELMLKVLDPNSGVTHERWLRLFFQVADGSVCEAKVFLSVDLLSKTELSAILYVYPSRQTTDFILCDDSLNLVGLSASLMDVVKTRTKNPDIEFSHNIMNTLSIKDLIPTFDTSTRNADGVESDGILMFDKLISVAVKSKKQLTLDAKKSTADVIKLVSDLKLLAKFTVSLNENDILGLKYFRIIVSQLEEIKHTKVSYAGTKVSFVASRQDYLFEPTISEGLLKTKGEVSELKALEIYSKDFDKSENGNSNREHLDDRKDWNSSKKATFKVQDDRFEEKSSHIASSKLSGRERRMKNLITNLNMPMFLIRSNFLGYIAVIGLILLAVVSYVIINSGYNKFSQYSGVAPFPAYLNSAVRSVFGSTEVVVGINRGFYPAAFAASLKKTVAISYVQRVQRFMAKYSQYMVDFDIADIAPGFDWSNYDMNVTRDLIYPVSAELSIYQVSRMFASVGFKLSQISQTKFDQITGNSSEVAWLRTYVDGLIINYEKLRGDLFTDYYKQHDYIRLLFDIVLILGFVVTIALMVMLVSVIRAIEKRKFELMKQLMTIPTSLINSHLAKLQIEYEAYFGSKLSLILTGNQNFVPDSSVKKTKSSKSHNSINKRRIVKTNEISLFKISLWMLIPMIYILSYYVIFNVYFKYKTTQTIPFIKNIDLNSRALVYPAYGLSLVLKASNLYDDPSLSVLQNTSDRVFAEWSAVSVEIVEMMQSVRDTLLSSSEVSAELVERYQNISGILVCDDIITNPNYRACQTAFGSTADHGFAAAYQKLLQYTDSLRQMFFANVSLDSALNITNDPFTIDRSAFSVGLDATVVANLDVGESNVSAMISRIQTSLTIFMAIGILQMASTLFMIWRPFYRRITRHYLDCRRVFAILPVHLIIDNKNILHVLKKQDRA